MTGYTIKEFRKVPLFHILFGMVLFGLFAAGFLLTQQTSFERKVERKTKNGTEEEMEGVLRYYIFGAIGGGLHMLLLVLACLVNETVKAKETYQNAQGWIGFYRLLLFPFLPYCIAGAVVTGIHGICANFEHCIYQENQGANLGIAIGITVMHALSFLLTFYIISRSTQTENEIKELNKPAPKPAAKKTTDAKTTAAPPKSQESSAATGKSTSTASAKSTTTPPKSQGQSAATGKSTPAPSDQSKTASPKPTGAAAQADKKKSEQDSKSKRDPPNPEPKTNDAKKPSASPKEAAFTQEKPPTPQKNEASAQEKTNGDTNAGQNSKSVTVTVEQDKMKGENLAATNDEEEALRLLRRHQLEEAMRNGQRQPDIRFTDDGRAYIPVFLPTQVPPPPSYETATAGVFPSDDPLQPHVVTFGADGTSLYSPGLVLEQSRLHNLPDPTSVVVHPNQVSDA